VHITYAWHLCCNVYLKNKHLTSESTEHRLLCGTLSYRFWCQLIFDHSLHRCIDSYLNEARRPHDITDSTEARRGTPSDVSACEMSLHRLFFLTCLRSSTHHESPASFIDGKVFGDILYENYIFDIPRLMDICVVYGHGSDCALVTKMIGNIFLQQPKYNDDLLAVVSTIEKVTGH